MWPALLWDTDKNNNCHLGTAAWLSYRHFSNSMCPKLISMPLSHHNLSCSFVSGSSKWHCIPLNSQVSNQSVILTSLVFSSSAVPALRGDSASFILRPHYIYFGFRHYWLSCRWPPFLLSYLPCFQAFSFANLFFPTVMRKIILLPKFNPATSHLINFQWFSVAFNIKCKLCSLMDKCPSDQALASTYNHTYWTTRNSLSLSVKSYIAK